MRFAMPVQPTVQRADIAVLSGCPEALVPPSQKGGVVTACTCMGPAVVVIAQMNMLLSRQGLGSRCARCTGSDGDSSARSLHDMPAHGQAVSSIDQQISELEAAAHLALDQLIAAVRHLLLSS
jgi:hypothetical protein